MSYKASNIAYYKMGKGSRTLICFHGYSNDGTLFQLLESPMQDKFTILSIDLPHHGQTWWRNGKLSTQILKEIVDQILITESLPLRYSLLGFSLGGRVAMCLFEKEPQRVERIILLAPDGLYHTIWYHFLVRTWLGNKLMAFLLNKPQKAKLILEWSKKRKIINGRVYGFAMGFIHSKRQTTLLYARWVSMRALHPNIKNFCSKLKDFQVPLSLVFGNADNITPVNNARYLIEQAGELICFEKWEAGHLLLREKYLTQLLSLFN